MIQVFLDFIEKIKVHGLEYYGIYYSSYPGIVVDNNDPDQRGRVQVEVPTILGKGKTLAAWAEPKDRDIAGHNTGSFFTPYVGDFVTVYFEHGNLRYPLYTGGFWARGEVPNSFKDGYPNIRGWVFKSGQQLVIDEREGKIRILLSNPSGSQLLIDDTNGKEIISLVHKSGSNFTIDEKSTVTILSSTGSSLVMDGETGECFFRTKDGAELRMNEIVTIQEQSGSGKITISESLVRLMSKELIELVSTQFRAQVDQAFIGRNAAYSAVLAENLQSAFDAHAHVTGAPGAPTSPPIIPLSALAGTAMDIAAQKVKIKGNIG